MNPFYSALQSARYSPKQPDLAMPIPEYLAQVTVSVENAEERIRLGKERLYKLVHTGSMNELSGMLPVFGEFFGYIY